MGHQIHAGHRDIAFSKGAWLVVRWRDRIAPVERPAGMADWEWADLCAGCTVIPVEAVMKMDADVPLRYRTARDQGFCAPDPWGWSPNVCEFTQCRLFLRFAAKNGLEISGGW